jgi:hypothetical protein
MSAMADTAVRPRSGRLVLWLFLNRLPRSLQTEYHQNLKRPAIFSAGVFMAGNASGLMNLGFGIAGIILLAVAGMIIDASGSHTLPFVASMALPLPGAALAFRMRPDCLLATNSTAG